MTAENINFAELLRQYGIQPKKSLGQNFLFDTNIINNLIRLSGVSTDTTVLEIGAGPGNLTRALADHARRVVAVELDQRFMPLLELAGSQHPNLEVIYDNILSINLDALMRDPGYVVVANLPYYITSAVIRKLLETHLKPSRLALTVQKEVASRICARPGELSLLAVSVRVYGSPSLALAIPAGAFYPAPKVDSAVILIETHPAPLLPEENLEAFFRIVKAGFSQKRKKLRNTLSAGLRIPLLECEQMLKSVDIDPSRRPQTLDPAEWVALTDEFIRKNPKKDA